MQGPDGQPLVMLGLADARQISDKMVVLPMAAQHLLGSFSGQNTLDEILAAVAQNPQVKGLTRPILESMVAQLDDAGLLMGPKFDAMLAAMRADFDSEANLPPGSSMAFVDALLQSKAEGGTVTDELRRQEGPAALREAFDQWIAKALENQPNPSFDELPTGVMVPHIDYYRGWANYASVWGRMRVVDRPDRVLILGTNHFGLGTGVTACDKGYTSILGTSPVDRSLLDLIVQKLGKEKGDAMLANRYDHEREHSVELQVPWIQHVFGADSAGKHVPVLGVLVHDPATNSGESYDGKGLALEPFVEAVRAALEQLGGKTLVVSSADLSHVGPMFGDQVPLGGDEEQSVEARNKVIQHDQEMLNMVTSVKPDDLISSMAWQQNPTRWCSVGNIAAMLKITRPEQVQLLNYMGAMDPQGAGLVTSAAAVAR
jgi:AmmeMemoRadiSam system protein B